MEDYIHFYRDFLDDYFLAANGQNHTTVSIRVCCFRNGYNFLEHKKMFVFFQLLYDEFRRDPSYLWIDDVFITGVLAKRAGIRHKSMASAFALAKK